MNHNFAMILRKASESGVKYAEWKNRGLLPTYTRRGKGSVLDPETGTFLPGGR